MIDMLAGAWPHFVDHLAPIWHALPREERGVFLVTLRRIAEYAASLGISPISHDWPDEDRPILVSSFGDQKIAARDHGRTRIARIEHGIGQSFVDSRNGSYAGGTGAGQVSLFLCPNEHSARRWQDAYPHAAVEVVGCPKLATLPAREPSDAVPPVVATSFHWDGGSLTTKELIETRGAWGEYQGILPALARRYSVIGHGHPRAQVSLRLERYYGRMGIPFVPTFAEVCRQADVYVCDTNSTLYEFASTGRPVVVVNSKYYRRDLEHGLRFWEAAGVGVNCDDPRALLDAVAEALRDAPERVRAREAALDIVYAYRDGSEAQRAADALLSWAGAREMVAA